MGCVEPHFYAELLDKLGLTDAELPHQFDFDAVDKLKAHFSEVFKSRTRDEWAMEFADSDACVTPVLSPFEAHLHPHNSQRGTFVEVGSITQPAPAPRFSRTPAAVPAKPPTAGQDTDRVLAGAGYDPESIAQLRAAGAVE